MENAERMLIGCDVVAEHKVKLIHIASAPCNRGYCVMRDAVGFGKDKGGFIAVSTPARQNFIGKLDKAFSVGRLKPDCGHRPFNDACPDILKAREADFRFNRCTLHCKFISAALKMLVAENGAADYRQIGV